MTYRLKTTQDNGVAAQVVSDSAKTAPNAEEIAEVAKSVECLAHPLGLVDILDVFNPMGCLAFATIGIIVFLLNPVRLFVSFGYHCSDDARLKEGRRGNKLPHYSANTSLNSL